MTRKERCIFYNDDMCPFNRGRSQQVTHCDNLLPRTICPFRKHLIHQKKMVKRNGRLLTFDTWKKEQKMKKQQNKDRHKKGLFRNIRNWIANKVHRIMNRRTSK